MSKSVYIFDTPANCKGCTIEFCEARVYADHRPDDCPLRPLPQKEVCNDYEFETYTNGFNRGFNRCLEMITPKSTS